MPKTSINKFLKKKKDTTNNFKNQREISASSAFVVSDNQQAC